MGVIILTRAMFAKIKLTMYGDSAKWEFPEKRHDYNVCTCKGINILHVTYRFLVSLRRFRMVCFFLFYSTGKFVFITFTGNTYNTGTT